MGREASALRGSVTEFGGAAGYRCAGGAIGAVRACRAFAGAVPVAELDGHQAIAALSDGRSPPDVGRLHLAFPAPVLAGHGNSTGGVGSSPAMEPRTD